MPSYVTVPIDGFTQTTVEGALDLAASAEILHQIAADADAQQCHLLIDLRDATATGLSYVDVYRLVGMLADHPTALSCRIALLDTFREGFEKVQFFEASAASKGLTVRAFLSEGKAVEWLERTATPA